MLRLRRKLSHLQRPLVIFFLISLVVGINLFISLFGLYSFDLTKEKQYSLSPVSKNILARLPDQVTVKVYISSSLPPRFYPLKNYLLTSLQQMSQTARHKLVIQVLDPDKNSQARQEAKNYGLPEVEFTVISNEQYQTKKGFFGLVILFTDRTAVMPVLNQIGSFEYEFIRRLLKLTAEKEPKLYIDKANNEDFSQSQRFYQELTKEYNVVEIDVNKGQNLIDSQAAKAILVYNPREKWSQTELDFLKRWLAKGKSLIIFADPLNLDANFKPHFNCQNLNTLLQPLGISLSNQLVFSAKGELISYNVANLPLAVLKYYGFWFKIYPSDVKNDVAWKNDLIGTTFLWAGNLRTKSDKIEKLIVKPKINLVSCPTNIQPESYRFNSDDLKTADISLLVPYDKGRILVIADADFIADKALNRYPQNLKLGLDLVDLLAFDQRLLQLRSKTVNSHLMRSLTTQEKATYKTEMLLSPLVVIIVLGLVFAFNKYLANKKLSITSS